jgi:hypothetical protein
MRSTIRLLAVSLVLSLVLCWAAARASDKDEGVFYSIHLDTFERLEDANRKVNSLKEKGKIVFWEKTEIPGMGERYKVYMGRYDSWQDAFRYWRQLKKAGLVTHFGIHWFNDPFRTTAPEPEPMASTRRTARPAPGRTRPAARFIDNLDGTITDLETRLMWTQNGWRMDFLSAATWEESVEKCRHFRLGGYDNWRLPTVEEWKRIIDPGKRNPAIVVPNPFVNLISHMPYWTQTQYTYGIDLTCARQCPVESYTVILFSGRINHQKKSELAFILPVRDLK